MRLAKCSAAIFIALCILCLLSIGIGSSQAPVDLLATLGISHCGESLCIDGIQPRITTWDDSKTKLSALPDATHNGDDAITIVQNGATLVFWKSLDSEKTHVIIESDADSQLFALQELVRNFGQPCSLDITQQNIYLEYPQFIASAASSEQQSGSRLNMSAPVTTLYLPGQPQACNKPVEALANKNISTRWCGFSSINHYVNQCQK